MDKGWPEVPFASVEKSNKHMDTFILNKKRIKKICGLIKPLGIKWFFLTRVDHVDYELFLELKNATLSGKKCLRKNEVIRN